MLLYSIRNTQTGKFYKGDDWKGLQYWSGTPRYWQTIDGVRKNLIRIGSDYRGETYANDGPWKPDEEVYGFKRYANFTPSRLELIEIIITDVKVLGEKREPALSYVTEEQDA